MLLHQCGTFSSWSQLPSAWKKVGDVKPCHDVLPQSSSETTIIEKRSNETTIVGKMDVGWRKTTKGANPRVCPTMSH
jgi:hypothetical protein